MIIDFHTHAFPDTLAPKALHVLTTSIDNIYPPVHDGTVSGTLRNMDNCGVDLSVVLPVVTRQEQFVRSNEWIAAIESPRLVAFGGIYPHTDDYKRDIDFVVSLGLRGLKFHAEYQEFVLDEPKMLKIYDYALGKGLILLHHAGFDPAYPPPFRSTPQQFARVVQLMRGGVIIAAHFGGHDQWDEVLEHLAGEDIYLDTSMGFEYFTREQFLSITEKHGADRILFGSDAPWSDAKDEIARLNAMPLSDEDKAAILGGNGRRLLGV